MSSWGYLNLTGLNLKRLPVLPLYLEVLDCRNNLLTFLPKIPYELEELNCCNNLLTGMPLIPKTLEYLTCKGNNFLWNYSRCINICCNRWMNNQDNVGWNNYKILNKIRRRFLKRKRRGCYSIIKDVITNDLAGVAVKYL